MRIMIVKDNKGGTRFRDDRYGTLWELVAPATSACQSCGLAFVEVEPGKESPAHYHRHTEEVYHLVGGAGVVTLAEVETAVRAGDTVAIPPGVVHKIRASPGGLAFIVVTVPPYDPEDDVEV